MRNHVERLLEACYTCADRCDEYVSACLRQTGELRINPAMALVLDCAELCRFIARFVTREGEFTAILCRACAEICEHCAEALQDLGPLEADCAAACRSCASVCREGQIGSQAAIGSPVHR